MTDDIAKKIEAQILAQRPDGYTDQADSAQAGVTGGIGLHDVPLHH